ncbi:MAG: alpha/beta fold hydrolase, partial [Caulobacteraceae bacterium]
MDAKSNRRFFLDFPCNLKRSEKVVVVLLLHGHGSSGAWVRNYFPAALLKDKYRLVIATPTAASATRDWSGTDDSHLQNITEQIIGEVGRENVRALWLAGHSAGGAYANRIVCNDYLKDRVDGWLSLSGGRIGKVQPSAGVFGAPPPPGSSPNVPPVRTPPGAGGYDAPPACDINFIFESGDQEIVALPATSPWAEKYGCGPRGPARDVTDARPGIIDEVEKGPPNPALGRKARPGVAKVMIYPNCRGGRVLADVMRLDKG